MLTARRTALLKETHVVVPDDAASFLHALRRLCSVSYD